MTIFKKSSKMTKNINYSTKFLWNYFVILQTSPCSGYILLNFLQVLTILFKNWRFEWSNNNLIPYKKYFFHYPWLLTSNSIDIYQPLSKKIKLLLLLHYHKIDIKWTKTKKKNINIFLYIFFNKKIYFYLQKCFKA